MAAIPGEMGEMGGIGVMGGISEMGEMGEMVELFVGRNRPVGGSSAQQLIEALGHEHHDDGAAIEPEGDLHDQMHGPDCPHTSRSGDPARTNSRDGFDRDVAEAGTQQQRLAVDADALDHGGRRCGAGTRTEGDLPSDHATGDGEAVTDGRRREGVGDVIEPIDHGQLCRLGNHL